MGKTNIEWTLFEESIYWDIKEGWFGRIWAMGKKLGNVVLLLLTPLNNLRKKTSYYSERKLFQMWKNRGTIQGSTSFIGINCFFKVSQICQSKTKKR